uniref:Uncharacterized protein n=1 Tax=Anas zonorhyncha TaxID=75864 RepID=A0A8B9U2W8_9AVES
MLMQREKKKRKKRKKKLIQQSLFVRELPGCILFGWIFMSVALFLLMLITYFRIQLSEGESQFSRQGIPFRKGIPVYQTTPF